MFISDCASLTGDQFADPHRQRTVDWIDGTSGLACAFDFTTKAILQVYLTFSHLCLL